MKEKGGGGGIEKGRKKRRKSTLHTDRILLSGCHNFYFLTNTDLEVTLNKIKRKKKRKKVQYKERCF